MNLSELQIDLLGRIAEDLEDFYNLLLRQPVTSTFYIPESGIPVKGGDVRPLKSAPEANSSATEGYAEMCQIHDPWLEEGCMNVEVRIGSPIMVLPTEKLQRARSSLDRVLKR